MRLLLVEDDARIAQPTAEALREAGYAVTWAQTGPEGLEAAVMSDPAGVMTFDAERLRA